MGMKFTVVAVACLCVWTGVWLQGAPAGQAAAAGKGPSTWAGVYTDAQAQTGQTAYTKHCAECHGQDFAGDGFAPSLKGPEFMNNWNGLSVGDLYERIRISMPPADPNAASAKEKADIVAYLLKSNGFPAGKADLAPQLDALKLIKFEATKPGN